MTTIANLVVKLGADSSGFKKGLGGAGSALAGLGKSLARIAGGVALGGGGFGAFIGSSLKAADALNDLRLQTGFSGEFLSSMKQGLELNGSSVEALASSFIKFTKNVTGAVEPSKKVAAALESIGVTAEDFKRLTPDSQMRLLAEGISRVQDPAEQTAAFLALMGANAKTLLPTFKLGARGLAEIEEQARKTNAVISTESMIAADRALDAWTTLGNSLTGFGRQFALEFAEPIASAVESVTKLLVDFAPKIRAFFAGATQNLDALAAIAVQAAQGNFAGAIEIDRTLKADVKAAFEASLAKSNPAAEAQVQVDQLAELRKLVSYQAGMVRVLTNVGAVAQ